MFFFFKVLFSLFALGIHFAGRAIAALLSSRAAKIVGCMLRPAATLADLEASHLDCADKQHDLDAANAELEELEQACQAVQLDCCEIEARAAKARNDCSKLEGECDHALAEIELLRLAIQGAANERDLALTKLARRRHFIAWAHDIATHLETPPPSPPAL
ncbi:hypothetical protein H4S01_003965 [Coemansia sp. RSA 2610]|nr:hypothetical protein H4S01_003965 [Coemansia sp. RSA 2610]